MLFIGVSLFALLHASSVYAQDSVCVVVSGLKKDETGAFSKFADATRLAGCAVVGSMQEVTDLKLEGKVVDLRVLSHGQADGTLVCDSRNESPTKVIELLREIGEKNETFVTIESCFSEAILKEKNLREKYDLAQHKSMSNLCLYAASAPRRETFVNETSFEDFLFPVSEKIKKKSVLEVYQETNIGLISASPFESSGVIEFWDTFETTETTKKFITFLNSLPKSLTGVLEEKCSTLTLGKNLTSQEFSELGLLLNAMRLHQSRIPQYTATRRALLANSFDRLLENFNTKEAFENWMSNGYANYSRLNEVCNKFAPEEVMCEHIKHGVNSDDIDYLTSRKQLLKLYHKISGKQIETLESHDHHAIMGKFLEIAKSSQDHFTESSMKSAMGVMDESTQQDGLLIAESSQTNWSGFLSSAMRVSLKSPQTATNLHHQDQIRRAACEKFYYDEQGILRVQK